MKNNLTSWTGGGFLTRCGPMLWHKPIFFSLIKNNVYEVHACFKEWKKKLITQIIALIGLIKWFYFN